MQESKNLQHIVNQFVQTEETEKIIGSTYLLTCLEGFRNIIMDEMKEDLLDYSNRNKITDEELAELMNKYMSKIPPEIMTELYGEIIKFIQEYPK